MRALATRFVRWTALPGLFLALALSAASVPASAEEIADEASGQTLASTDRPSFVFPNVTRIQGFGWEIDTGGPGVRSERFFQQ